LQINNSLFINDIDFSIAGNNLLINDLLIAGADLLIINFSTDDTDLYIAVTYFYHLFHISFNQFQAFIYFLTSSSSIDP